MTEPMTEPNTDHSAGVDAPETASGDKVDAGSPQDTRQP